MIILAGKSTYPDNSSIEPRLTLRRWEAVIGKGPQCPSPIPGDTATDIDCERFSKREQGMAIGGKTILVRAAARAGSEPRPEPESVLSPPILTPPREPELSRRNKPMTDLCLGLFIPPEYCSVHGRTNAVFAISFNSHQ